MSLFSRKSRPAADGLSVVDEHLTVRGELETQGSIRVDGRVEGTSHRIDTLVIGPKGMVVGDVEAREVVVAGTLVGHVRATSRIEIQAKATVRGDVTAGAMLLHEGGVIQGHLAVTTVEEVPVARAEGGAPARLVG